MHPRKRLQRILDETGKFITDVESWNENRTDAPPIDCEPERVLNQLARKAAAEWDDGNREAAGRTMAELSQYAEHVSKPG